MKTLNQMKIQNHSQSGFTFIEVIIAIGVLSFGILGLITTTHSVSVNQRNADNVTEATMIATDELENIKRLSTNEPLGGTFGFRYLVNSQAGGYINSTDFPNAPDDWTRWKTEDNSDDPEIPVGFDRMTRIRVHPFNDTNITDVENFSSTQNTDNIHMIEATVVVTWNDHTGSQKGVTLSTVLQRRQIIQ